MEETTKEMSDGFQLERIQRILIIDEALVPNLTPVVTYQ